MNASISTRTVVTFLISLLLAHLAALFFGWYVYPMIDLTLHFLGGIWSGLFFFLLFSHFVGEHAQHQTSEKIKILIIVVAFSSLLGVFWEAQQFFLSEYFSFYLQRSVGEMIISLLINIVGGVASSVAILYLRGGKTRQAV